MAEILVISGRERILAQALMRVKVNYLRAGPACVPPSTQEGARAPRQKCRVGDSVEYPSFSLARPGGFLRRTRGTQKKTVARQNDDSVSHPKSRAYAPSTLERPRSMSS